MAKLTLTKNLPIIIFKLFFDNVLHPTDPRGNSDHKI